MTLTNLFRNNNILKPYTKKGLPTKLFIYKKQGYNLDLLIYLVLGANHLHHISAMSHVIVIADAWMTSTGLHYVW